MNYKINDDRILFSPLGEEAVVFDKESNEYITLNETMFKIFQGIGNGQSTEAIQENLLKEYEIDAENCQKAIERSINSLLEKGFIVAA
jgi:hypothetical protein